MGQMTRYDRLIAYPDRARRLALVGALAICGAWAVASLTFPFGWDQGIMAGVGDVVLRGGMPYRDAWDIKGPLAHLWFALAQWLFGKGQLGIRLLDLALLAWAALALARAASRLTRPAVGPWVAAGLVLAHGSLTYFFTAQPDGAVSFMLVLGLAPLLSAPPRPRDTIVAGLIVGLATLVKPLYIVFLALPLLALVRTTAPTLRRRAVYALWVVTAAAVPILLMLAWFQARGAMADLVEVLIRYNATSYSGVTDLALRERATGLASYLWSGPRAVALPFIVFGACLAWRRDWYTGAMLTGWTLGALAVVAVQGKFFLYHWSVVFPPAVLLTAVAIHALQSAGVPDAPHDGGVRSHAAILAYAATAAILLPLAIQPCRDVKNLVRWLTRIDTAEEYYSRFIQDNVYVAGEEMAAAAYLRDHTTPEDHIAILGYDAPVVYLSGRENATRFGYALPLVGWLSSEAIRSAYQREFMEDLQEQPAYVIVGLLFPGKDAALGVFPEFAEYLERHYEWERSFGHVDLYRRAR